MPERKGGPLNSNLFRWSAFTAASGLIGAAAAYAGSLYVGEQDFAASFYYGLSPERAMGRGLSGALSTMIAGVSFYLLSGRRMLGAASGVALGSIASYGIGAGDLPFGMSGLGFSNVSALADSWYPKSWTNAYMIEELEKLGISPNNPLVKEFVIDEFDRDHDAAVARARSVRDPFLTASITDYEKKRQEYFDAVHEAEDYVRRYAQGSRFWPNSDEVRAVYEQKLERARAAARAYVEAGQRVGSFARGAVVT